MATSQGKNSPSSHPPGAKFGTGGHASWSFLWLHAGWTFAAGLFSVAGRGGDHTCKLRSIPWLLYGGFLKWWYPKTREVFNVSILNWSTFGWFGGIHMVPFSSSSCRLSRLGSWRRLLMAYAPGLRFLDGLMVGGWFQQQKIEQISRLWG